MQIHAGAIGVVAVRGIIHDAKGRELYSAQMHIPYNLRGYQIGICMSQSAVYCRVH